VVIALSAFALGVGLASGPAASAAPPRGFLHVFDYDRSAPLRARTTLQGQNDIARVEHVTFLGAGGERVPALVSRPRSARGRTPCLLEGHRLTSSKDEIFAAIADIYAARGVTVMSIDARYHGERQGIGPLRAASRLDTMYKLFRYTVIDMRRALDYLGQRRICDPARTGYEGESLGGFMGSMLIGADRRIKAAALFVSGADWRIYLSHTAVWMNGPLSGDRLNAAVRKLGPLDPKYWIPRADGRPVFIASGRQDYATPFVAAQALHRAAREPKQIVIYNGGHDIEEPHGARVRRAAALFFNRTLHIRTG
jgi:uncharacterized protein